MIKVTTAKEVLQMLREGKEVYYFDIESKEVAPLSKVLESVPGVFLTEENSSPEQTPSPPEPKVSTPVPTALTHYDYGIPIEDDPEYFPQEKKNEKGKPVKKGIDKGKVKALRRAGWSIPKIADEMGVSTATIGYHLKQFESEVQ